MTACLDSEQLKALSASPGASVGSVAGLLLVKARGAERGRLEAILALLCSCAASVGGERVWEYAVAGAGSGVELPLAAGFLAGGLEEAKFERFQAERARVRAGGAPDRGTQEEGRILGLLGLLVGTMPVRLAAALAGAVPEICPGAFERAGRAIAGLAETSWEDQPHYALLVDYAGARREELLRGCAALAEACGAQAGGQGAPGPQASQAG